MHETIPLTFSHNTSDLMNCPICQTEMRHAFDAKVLGKHPASYFHCTGCGIIKPQNPTWLPESYSSAIAETDVGLVSRNLRNRDLLGAILTRLHPASGRILDIGGGYGLLCRLMRDKDWDCYTTDTYCKNLFASSYEPPEGFTCPTLLAFEVFEHIEDPLSFTREQIQRYGAQCLIFSTLTHSWDIPPLDWWYYTFETGQHISIYKQETLARLASEIGWNYLSISDELHVISKISFSWLDRLLLCRKSRLISRPYRTCANLQFRPKSRMMEDYREIKERVLRSQSGQQS